MILVPKVLLLILTARIPRRLIGVIDPIVRKTPKLGLVVNRKTRALTRLANHGTSSKQHWVKDLPTFGWLVQTHGLYRGFLQVRCFSTLRGEVCFVLCALAGRCLPPILFIKLMACHLFQKKKKSVQPRPGLWERGHDVVVCETTQCSIHCIELSVASYG